MNNTIDCVKCKRWKLFNDKACATHPDFKTEKELAEEQRKKDDAKLMEPFDILMYTSAIRVAGAFGQGAVLSNIAGQLNARGDEFTEKVMEEVNKLGPMTEDEVINSMLAYSTLMHKK